MGLCAFVPSARAQVDNTNYTVHCETVTKGSIKLAPALVNGGTSATAIKIGGTLGGCTSTPALPFLEGKSKFKGLLNAATNDCGNLLGPVAATGTLTFTWGVAAPGVTQKVSTVTISSGGAVGGSLAVGGGLYGLFGLGTPHGGVALSVAGGFQGMDSGASSGGYIVTQQSAFSLLNTCASLTGLKALNIGVAQVDLQ